MAHLLLFSNPFAGESLGIGLLIAVDAIGFFGILLWATAHFISFAFSPASSS